MICGDGVTRQAGWETLVKINQLESFRAIALSGSISGAALAQGTPSTTLSRHLKELEEDLGVTLIERTTHQCTLTSWGETFLEHAETVLDSFQSAREAIDSLKTQPKGHLNVLAPSAFGRRMIAPLLPNFQRLYPDISISLTLDNRNPDLHDAGMDIAFRIGNAPVGSERFETIGSAPFVAVASPSYLQEHPAPRSPDDLEQLAFISVSTRRSKEQWQLQKGDIRTDVTLTPSLNVFDPTAVRDMVVNGAGFGIIASAFCNRELQQGTLTQLLPDYDIPARQHYAIAYLRASSASSKAQAFLRYIKPALSASLAAP